MFLVDFGRHVARCPKSQLGGGIGLALLSGEPEVTDPNFIVVGVYKDVIALEVAVDDGLGRALVEVLEPL